VGAYVGVIQIADFDVDCVGMAGRSPVDSRGGQLEIAGVVVGSWRGREGAPAAR
jgi:hypothetical protein